MLMEVLLNAADGQTCPFTNVKQQAILGLKQGLWKGKRGGSFVSFLHAEGIRDMTSGRISNVPLSNSTAKQLQVYASLPSVNLA